MKPLKWMAEGHEVIAEPIGVALALAMMGAMPPGYAYWLADSAPQPDLLKLLKTELEGPKRFLPAVYVPNDLPTFTCTFYNKAFDFGKQMEALRRFGAALGPMAVIAHSPATLADPEHFAEMLAPHAKNLWFLDPEPPDLAETTRAYMRDANRPLS